MSVRRGSASGQPLDHGSSFEVRIRQPFLRFCPLQAQAGASKENVGLSEYPSESQNGLSVCQWSKTGFSAFDKPLADCRWQVAYPLLMIMFHVMWLHEMRILCPIWCRFNSRTRVGCDSHHPSPPVLLRVSIHAPTRGATLTDESPKDI